MDKSTTSTNSSPALSVQSVTFVATTNKVVATKFDRSCLPIEEAIKRHETFQTLAEGQKTLEKKKKNNATSLTIIQCSSPVKELVWGEERTYSAAYLRPKPEPTHPSERKDMAKGCLATPSVQPEPSSQQLFPCNSGLISAVLSAYNGHHNLILRPDDVWQAVLTQFSIYLTANAEELRDAIVDFQGQRELTIRAFGTLFTVDFGALASRMVDEQILTNIKDKCLVPWLLPSFTTTTANDRVAAAVSTMSALQKYFKYKIGLLCGIPNVTLRGSPQDWSDLRSKFDGLLRFELPGKTYMKRWHEWLAYIGDNLVKSARGEADVRFWDRVASHHGGGSGPSYVSGWISAFAVWSDEGKWQGATEAHNVWNDDFVSEFPIINTNDLPSGVATVPVCVDDNGKMYECTMFSGQFGFRVDGDTISPMTDWCIATRLH